MTGARPDACLALAFRRSPEEIERQRRRIETLPGARLFMTAPGLNMILNGERQIVGASRLALESLGLSLEAVLGLRPGEALGCVHAFETPGGCGTTDFCAECGAVNAILDGLAGRKAVQECRIARRRQERIESLDLRVAASPLLVDGESFAIFALQDISHEKRRRALERIFFHDILNSAGALKGLTGLIREQASQALKPHADRCFSDLSRLLDAIVVQKDLLAAENGELEPSLYPMAPRDLLVTLAEAWRVRPEARGKRVETVCACDGLTLVTDFGLLDRVLSSMTLNALEAVPTGERVRLSCVPAVIVHGDAALPAVDLAVTNPGLMPQEARRSVFQRVFSTKGEGRGLGCWTMRLIAERYLGGTVSFDCADAETTFRIRLPLTPACSRSPA